MTEEFELRFLLKSLPENFSEDLESKEVFDIYLPSSAVHPRLRIRKKGAKYEITKKELVSEEDRSHSIENTIPLSEEEYAELSILKGKRLRKLRYNYTENNIAYEIDIYQDELKGLRVVDIEFSSAEEKSKFTPPAWLGAEVTHAVFLAGGMLSGKSFSDIKHELDRFIEANIT